MGIREKWSFTKTSACSSNLPYSGSEEEAMEFLEKKRSETLYPHTCFNRCKDKGKLNNIFLKSQKVSLRDTFGVCFVYPCIKSIMALAFFVTISALVGFID